MKFVGRHREMQTLESFYQSANAGLLILYGRRRIGKTRLITHFLESHEQTPTFYWVATTYNEVYQLRDFSQAIMHHDPRIASMPSEDFTFVNWEDALNHLADFVASQNKPYLVVLDEFTGTARKAQKLQLWDGSALLTTGIRASAFAREGYSFSWISWHLLEQHGIISTCVRVDCQLQLSHIKQTIALFIVVNTTLFGVPNSEEEFSYHP